MRRLLGSRSLLSLFETSCLAPAAVIAAAIGFALWFTTSLVTGKREPWDASAYWLSPTRSPCSPAAFSAMQPEARHLDVYRSKDSSLRSE
jgi:hypothetical protein